MLCNDDLLLFNNRDQQVFDKVFRLFYTRLYLYACHLIKNETEAKDIINNVFLEMLNNKQKTFDKAEDIPVYLFWLTKNRCFDFLKKQKKQKARTKELIDQYDDTDDGYSQIQDDMLAIEAVLTIIDQLPGKYGQVVRLIFYERLTYPEIAARLNISRNMVSKLKLYAIREIKRLNNI
jgi:RNA polymerase sigma-70 factor (ECF subfamily)